MRKFLFISLSQTINGQPAYLPYPNDAEVLLSVDMHGAKDRNGIEFATMENVSFYTPSYLFSSSDSSWHDSLGNYSCFMFDDGTHGDKIANDGFWSLKLYFPFYSPIINKYKYSANYGLGSNGGQNNNESDDSLYHYLKLPDIGHGSEIIYGEILDVFGKMIFQDITTNVEQLGNNIPSKYLLKQNYPNPFNPTTMINFSIPESGLVTLKIFNILGQEVAELVNEVKSAGNYEVEFNANSIHNNGQNLTSGIYIYRIVANSHGEVGKFSASKKMVLIK